MDEQRPYSAPWRRCWSAAQALYRLLAPRATAAIVFAALFCNLAVKFFHAARYGLLREYPGWILTDIAVLMTINVVLALICYRWPRRWVIRSATSFAAIVCVWSVLNAGWVIRTGTQILPMVLLPLLRDPLNIFWLVSKNLLRMPEAALVLLGPSAIALAFFFSVLAKPVSRTYHRKRFLGRIVASVVVAGIAVASHAAVSTLGSAQITAAGLRFNCQSRAVLSFVLPEYRHLARDDFDNAKREIPTIEQTEITLKPNRVDQNVVIVVLEGVQYSSTSLASNRSGDVLVTDDCIHPRTPHLVTLASQGAFFSNARSAVTHTTKALFGILTGRLPSASQDLSETIPVAKPYASLATILKKGLGYRTAFFQSAKGTFESRPGLVHNLGFETFWAREDLGDPNAFVGYLGSDEFALLQPVHDWVSSDDRPFLLVVLCSVTHDPYEVPEWYGSVAEDPRAGYQETINYTDRFIAALDAQLAQAGLADQTIFCVVGDHGEAFGEHRISGHERVAFEEVLNVVWNLRAPYLLEPGRRIDEPVSSIDVTPTILSLLGVDITPLNFDGDDVLTPLPSDRKVYFSGWMQQGPAGFIQAGNKFVYHPEQGTVSLHRLKTDPLELSGLDLPDPSAKYLSAEIVEWRRNTIFRLHQQETGQVVLFDSWLCKWNGRISTVKYLEPK